MFSSKTTSTAQQAPIALAALRIQTSVYGLVIPIVYGTNRLPANLIGYNDFLAIPHTSVDATASSGGGKGAPSQPPRTTTTFTYQAAIQLGLCEGPIDGIGTVWQDKALTSVAALGLTVFTGTDPQTPWGYLSSAHPDQALGYNGLAYVANPTFSLGSDASLPNHTFEVQGRVRFNVGSGIVDANMADIVRDFLGNTHYGASFPTAYTGDFAQLAAYCTANGFFLSPVVDSQQEARQYLDDWAKQTNSAWVSTPTSLNLIPYGDQVVTGNGVTFTPDLTPQFDLGDDDFLEPPDFARSSPADAFNSIKIEIVDRSNDYNTVTVEAKDQAAIEAFGLRQDTSLTAHGITTLTVGQAIANLILQRALYIRNIYSFKIGWRFCRLDPMDLVTLTDPTLGMSRQLVRILTIDEDDKGALSVTAEQVDIGVASPAIHASSSALGGGIDTNIAPPASNPPLIFAAPVTLVSDLELWMAASGPPGWGGCDVWVSLDDAAYRNVGRMIGPSRMGVLSAAFAAGTDPDTVNTCSVDLSISQGKMFSGTAQDADLGTTLCYIADAAGGSEFFTYETATLTGANRYDLGTYLRRGLDGTPNAAHLAGARFARIDKAIFAIPYAVAQIGATIFVKLTAFNVYGAAEQALADVTATSLVCPAPPLPPDVTNFAVTQNGEAVTFRWGADTDLVVVGYDIRFGPAGVADWDGMLPLTEAGAGTEMTNASVPNGDWLFAIRAIDLAGQLSAAMAVAPLTVLNNYGVISSLPQQPGWTDGISTGFVTHFSGVLVPDSAVLANTDAAQDVFDNFVWKPVAQCVYAAPGVTLDKTAQLRAWASITARLGPGPNGTQADGKPNPLLFLRYSLTGAADPLMWNADPTTLMWGADPTVPMWAGTTPYMQWTKGVLLTAFVQQEIVVNTSDGLPIIQSFVPTVDQPPLTDGARGVVIAPGGSRIDFANLDFLEPPFVTPVAQGGLFATASAVDANGFTAHIYDTSAADVGGTLDNWTANN